MTVLRNPMNPEMKTKPEDPPSFAVLLPSEKGGKIAVATEEETLGKV